MPYEILVEQIVRHLFVEVSKHLDAKNCHHCSCSVNNKQIFHWGTELSSFMQAKIFTRHQLKPGNEDYTTSGCHLEALKCTETNEHHHRCSNRTEYLNYKNELIKYKLHSRVAKGDN